MLRSYPPPTGSTEGQHARWPYASLRREVRDALAHLHDPVELGKHPLVALVPGRNAAILRQELIEAIGTLHPGRLKAARRGGVGRGYQILRRRYLDALDPPAVQAELAIGKSQYYREHEDALAALVAHLVERWKLADRLDSPAPARPGQPGAFPRPGPLHPLPVRIDNLPRHLTSFVAREAEVAAIKQLLAGTCRLLTLTGPAGSGKTRLAEVAAGELRGAYANGVGFVVLATIADPSQVLAEIARALNVAIPGDRPVQASLIRFLADKQLLLVLDNFEQVVDAAPDVAELLAACPSLSVLVTSRTALRVQGEQEFPVSPLPLPDLTGAIDPDEIARNPAVALFCARSRAVQPSFALTAANARAIAEVCVRLDGLPLAIELAAAHSKVLAPAALLHRLERRLDLLGNGPRDLPARHQTLRAAIAWSHDTLDADEQRLFRRLAVFVGGFPLEAAEWVSGVRCQVSGVGEGWTQRRSDIATQGRGIEATFSASPRPGVSASVPPDTRHPTPDTYLLEALVNKSLVQVGRGTGDDRRFTMLETVREYAGERLAEAGEVELIRARHRDWCAALAGRAEPEVRGAGQLAWMQRLDDEHDNLGAALADCLENDPVAGLRLAGNLWRFWRQRGYHAEGRRWLDALLAADEERGPGDRLARAWGLVGAGILASGQWDPPAARTLLEAGLAIFRDVGHVPGIAQALRDLSWVRIELGDDVAEVRPLLDECLELARALDDERGIAAALHLLAALALRERDFRSARTFAEESLGRFRRLNDAWSIRTALHDLGLAALLEGSYREARCYLEEGLTLARQGGDLAHVKWMLMALVEVSRAEGNLALARPLLAELLRIWPLAGTDLTYWVLMHVGNLAIQEGQVARGVRLVAAGQTFPGSPWRDYVSSLASGAGKLDAARQILGPAAFATARAQGQAMALEPALADALAWLEPDVSAGPRRTARPSSAAGSR